MQVGADEAGKGPVLGSMFAAAVRAPEAALPGGLRDSKELTARRREELDDRLRGSDRVEIGLAEVTTGRIDDPGTDMNTLTVAVQADALRAVAREADTAYLDAGDVDADRFGRRVGGRLGVDTDIRAEHGADARHPIVAAASVVAKVARDAHVTELAAEYGAVGSGYPSDPTTRSFLESYVSEHDGLPDCARASWTTSEDALAANGIVEDGSGEKDQSTLGEF
ncbi:MAG: ribonuclease HII [Halobacteriales archaeon]